MRGCLLLPGACLKGVLECIIPYNPSKVHSVQWEELNRVIWRSAVPTCETKGIEQKAEMLYFASRGATPWDCCTEHY